MATHEAEPRGVLVRIDFNKPTGEQISFPDSKTTPQQAAEALVQVAKAFGPQAKDPPSPNRKLWVIPELPWKRKKGNGKS